jgi:hypothetical protein
MERFELTPHTIQPVHAVLELLAQTAEEWSHIAILELVEGADNAIRLLACPHVVDEAVKP